MFWKNKNLKSEEYSEIMKKLVSLSTDIEILQVKVQMLQDKRWGKDKRKAFDKKEEETEKFKYNDGLDSVRDILKDGGINTFGKSGELN